MRKQCLECEYNSYCNVVLKFYFMYLKYAKCKQGRKVRKPMVVKLPVSVG